MAALEQARAQIEIALEADWDWAAFRQAEAGPDRLLHERALAGNPLFKSWLLLEQAIGDLKAKAAQRDEAANDDLRRIRGIDRALARRLAERGVTSYGQIAAWRADDVRDVATALGLGRRISRQNWIEQAALLDLRRRAGGPEPVAPSSSAAPSGTPAGVAPSIVTGRPRAHRIGLQQILEHIRNDAALRGDPYPAAPDRRDEAPDGPAAAAHVELPAQSESAAALSLDANAEMNEREQQEEQENLEAVDSGLGAEGAGRDLPEPEEATVTFVIRERVHAVDADSAERDEQAAPTAAEQAAAVEAADAPHAPPGVEAAEAEVVIVSRPAGRSAKSGRP